mmetsp:Transcript_13273/g.25141  ORF Transcript_13273/g.25141 Transcript_13273/m.25141 type:complete len:212 (-) Transcript_13273:112-747(-)
MMIVESKHWLPKRGASLVLLAWLLDRMASSHIFDVFLDSNFRGTVILGRVNMDRSSLDQSSDTLSKPRMVILGMNQPLGRMGLSHQSFGTSSFPALLEGSKVKAGFFLAFFHESQRSHHLNESLNSFHLGSFFGRRREVLIDRLVLNAMQHLCDIVFACHDITRNSIVVNVREIPVLKRRWIKGGSIRPQSKGVRGHLCSLHCHAVLVIFS